MAPLLDVQQVADALHLKPDTVRRWAGAGRLPSIRFGRRILFEPKDLQAAIARAKQPTAELAGA